MSITRLSALLEKDFKEATRNPSIIFMPLIILLLSFFYRFIMAEINDVPSAISTMQLIIINMSFIMVATATIINMFAEENEKGTLKGLIESPASKLEILISKVIVMTILTIIASILSLVILGNSIEFRFQTYIGLVLLLIFYLTLGLTFGLLSNNPGTATSFMMIPFILFGMSSIFETMSDTLDLGFFEQALNYLPFGLIWEIEINNTSLNFLYLTIWLVISIIVLKFVYDYKFRKR